MLSNRVIAKQLLKTTIAKTPQLALPACSTIVKYHKTLDPPRSSVNLVRGFATHSEEYEIDYISLKKKTKKKGEDINEKLNIDIALPNFTIKRPRNIGYPYYIIHDCNESLMKDVLDFCMWDFKVTNEKGFPQGLAYTEYYYDELKVFEQFLQDTFNHRIGTFADLSGLEIVNTLFIFRDYYTRGEIPQVTKETKSKFDEMVKFFVEFVNKDAQFPQTVVKEYFPKVKRSKEISDFLNLGLYFYVSELKALDREFNFKRIRSKNDLILQIDRMVGKFDHFLENSQRADESFFKTLIQAERYEALREKLAKTITPLKLIKALVETNNFEPAMKECMFENLSAKFDREEVNETLKDLCVVWSMLEFGNFIPATSKYNELAPRLYEISTTRDHPFADEAKNLLEVLTTDELRSGMLLSHFTAYNFHTAKYKFTGDLQEDWILNALLKWNFPLEVALTKDFEKEWCNFLPGSYAASEAFFGIDSSTVVNLAQNPDILIKFLELNGDSLTKCLPEGSLLLHMKKDLAAAKRGLGVDFAFYSDVDNLVKAIEKRSMLTPGSVDTLVSALEDASKYLGTHLEVLDEIAKGSDEVAIHDRHTSTNYKQIPDWLRLERHVAEIEFLKGLTGDFSDKTAVMSVIENVTNQILEDDTLWPEINHGSLLTLRAKLKEFSVNNTTDCLEILNTVLLSNDVFAQFEKHMKEKPAQKSAPYVQLPDELELYDFVNELTKLKHALGGLSFNEHTSDDVFKALDYQIESFFDDAKNKDSLISSNSESFKYIRLKRRLSRLFDMNGQNTDVLDVLLNSQAVFDGFEKRKMRSEKNIEEVSQEYRQMPNDFMLEEYVLELSQLKVSLNIERFADVYANEILGKIEEFSKANYSTSDKKLIWHKLYRNLALLFKHNHGSTFVLDNVLTSATEWEKLGKLVKPPRNPLSEQLDLLKKEEHDVLGAFLTASRLLYKSDVIHVSKEEFNSLVDVYIATLDATSLGYLFKKEVLASLKEYNAAIHHYPAFLVCLYGMSKNLNGEPITEDRLQEFYSDLMRSVNEETSAPKKQRLDPKNVTTPARKNVLTREQVSETPEVEYEYDIREYEPLKPDVRSANGSLAKQKYHNSEQYIADLDNRRNTVFKDETFEDAVRAAFVSALQNDDIPETESHSRSAHKPRKRLNDRTSATLASANAIDPAKVEEYLTRLNKDELSKQRQADAYKWSKTRYDQSVAATSKKYLLLSLIGDEIPVSENLIRDELAHKSDIFEILDKFSDSELAIVNDRLQCLQNENYKVVGYKLDGKRKYLILENEGERGPKGASGKSSWGKRATTGAVTAMLAYLGLSFISDEPRKNLDDAVPTEHPGGESMEPAAGEAKELMEIVGTPLVDTDRVTNEPELITQHEKKASKGGFNLKNILWNTK